jgi:hypothetical protein
MSDAKPAGGSNVRLFEGKVHRVRQAHGAVLVEGARQPAPECVRRPARVAVMLALAHKIQDAIDRGVVRDRAEVACKLGLSRARVTQLLDLTMLAPEVQEEILFTKSVDGSEPFTERRLRQLTRDSAWPAQPSRLSAQ